MGVGASRLALVVTVASMLGACGGDSAEEVGVSRVRPRPSATSSTVALGGESAGGRPPRPPAPSSTVPMVEVRYRSERRVGDRATAGFADVVRITLADPRGWVGAGFRLVEDPAAAFVIVLAEGDEVDRLCFPYRTRGRFSCQNGPIVAINADRWRTATDQWTGDLAAYRQMLVNHEVGHLLGQHHPPDPQCPAPGQPAPVMAQQSTELDGCLPNPWPLAHELASAARHEEPLAPPYQR